MCGLLSCAPSGSDNIGRGVGCTFSTLGGFGDASAVALESSQAFFQGCEFNQNYVGHDDAAAILARNSTAIILENTTFSGNYGKGQLLGTGPSGDGQEDASEFFADDADMQFCAGNALAMSVSAPADSTADFGVMEQWLERMQTVLPVLCAVPPCCAVCCADRYTWCHRLHRLPASVSWSPRPEPAS